MPARYHSLPSLTAIASFEAAARCASFKKAANDLNVTPAAISHQVKSLEAELGFQVFNRYHRGVELNEAGAFLYVAIQRGFGEISSAIEQLQLRADDDAVTIEATTAVSAFFLTPRLTRFWAHRGHIPVSQNVTDLPGTSPTSDLCIFYGEDAPNSGDCRLLFRDRISILASPEFAARFSAQNLTDLTKMPLIHLTASDARWTGWQSFLEMLGVTIDLGPSHYVNNYAIALQAAQDGVGAVLGWETLTRGLISSGSLVKLFPDSIEAPHGFYITARKNAPARAIELRDWLLAAA